MYLPRQAILKPGDTLYIPIGCWHYVRSLSPSISLNFWWDRKEGDRKVAEEIYESPRPEGLASTAAELSRATEELREATSTTYDNGTESVPPTQQTDLA